jgi:NAD(P)-dependent dehydrogenase (short-subunit alcohol dehydrogenase family)
VKTVIVTGAGAGLGAAICRRFASGGYRVGVLDRDPARCAEVAASLPDATALAADVTDLGAVQAAFDAFGPVPDVLVNNAGIVLFGPLLEQPPERFGKAISVNLMGTYTCSWVAATRMVPRARGAIINLTSINAVTPGPNAGGYPASKAAIASLTQHMALEWGPLGLRVNAIAPGFIDAGMSAPIYAQESVRKLRGDAVPSRRLGIAEDVAHAAWFLASDDAAYINGHQLVVDGGVVHSLLAQLPRA